MMFYVSSTYIFQSHYCCHSYTCNCCNRYLMFIVYYVCVYIYIIFNNYIFYGDNIIDLKFTTTNITVIITFSILVNGYRDFKFILCFYIYSGSMEIKPVVFIIVSCFLKKIVFWLLFRRWNFAMLNGMMDLLILQVEEKFSCQRRTLIWVSFSGFQENRL